MIIRLAGGRVGRRVWWSMLTAGRGRRHPRRDQQHRGGARQQTPSIQAARHGDTTLYNWPTPRTMPTPPPPPRHGCHLRECTVVREHGNVVRTANVDNTLLSPDGQRGDCYHRRAAVVNLVARREPAAVSEWIPKCGQRRLWRFGLELYDDLCVCVCGLYPAGSSVGSSANSCCP